jgi:hypothetical protein
MIQNHLFTVDLYVLGLRGAEVVLGAQWLKQLGPVLMDYHSLTMKFFHQGTCIELQGETSSLPSPINLHQLQKLTRVDGEAQFFSLKIYDPTHESLVLPSTPHTDLRIQNLLHHYHHLFAEPTQLPPRRNTDHHINLIPNAAPVNVRPYRYPQAQKTEIENQVAKMLKTGWIQPSTSPFSSPVLLLKKKDGTWRMCVDYRALNSITVRDRFPLPTIDELLDELGMARIFSKLDLTSGFHQIRLAPEDIAKTAFRTHDGHSEYCVMPFGLCNAPATFQATMNEIFRPLLRKTVIVFFDDILVFSPTLELHLQHLEQVFQILSKQQFQLKVSKCSFCQPQISYLGHIVTAGTVAPDPLKIQAVMDWPPPKTVKGLRGFLGLSGFYRKFVRGYATLALPLTNLLKKDAFKWSQEEQVALDALKQALATAPVLALPNFKEPFVVQTDASGKAMGAVLLQGDHPIAYFSKVFCPRMAKASAYLRELHAVTSAVKRWRQYLLGHFFIIQTDHKSLKELLTQVIQTPEQQFYLTKLLGYHYEIQYKPGSTNVVADALSRSIEPSDASFLALSMPQFVFLEELKQDLLVNDEFLVLRDQLVADPMSKPGYSFKDGLILFQGRIWLSPKSRFKDLLLKEFHETPVGGHAGIIKTLKRLAANFYWAEMRGDVKRFIASCVVCQQTKYSTQKPGGLLQPLPIPENVWEDISMDFVTGLPLSNGYSVIFVVVDRFSKALHLGALQAQFTAYKVAELFINMVCKIHGLPKSIVSDRDPVFVSKFWADLFKFSGTLLRMSSSYHPQTDGQTEVTNRTIEQYLRAFVHAKPNTWFRLLPWAEYHYNTSFNTASGLSPFQVMFGKPPPSIPTYVLGSSSVDACDLLLSDREAILALLRKNLTKAQATMKAAADAHRREVNFDVGTWVYVKLQPYRQISLAGNKYSKLSKRFYGPFQILERIGKVAYKLELPSYSKIHNVFHCSVLKPHIGLAPNKIDDLPAEAVENHPLVTPLAILAVREEIIDGKSQEQVLVQWQGLSPDDTSWEPWHNLQSIYNLEDKVGFDGEGIVMIKDNEVSASNKEEFISGTNKPHVRPKRIVKKPSKLMDYVLPKHK